MTADPHTLANVIACFDPKRPSADDKEWARNQFRSWANERATKPGAGGKPEPSPARPVRTITLRTFPRLTDEELAAVFDIPFGYDEITEVHA